MDKGLKMAVIGIKGMAVSAAAAAVVIGKALMVVKTAQEISQRYVLSISVVTIVRTQNNTERATSVLNAINVKRKRCSAS